jgi:mannan endo-1,4-beta-mannosidase
VPRSCALAVLLLTGCGLGPDDLEAIAAACPELPLRPFPGYSRSLVGLNAYYLQEESTRAVRRDLPHSPEVEETLSEARALGATFVRTWAFNDDAKKWGDSALQLIPGEYDEVAWRGLDRVLARAHELGLRLILPLGNYWDDYGGARQYVRWGGALDAQEGDARFFTHRPTIDLYRQHVRTLLDRVNSVDGHRYGAHPAVLGWELLNEPRTKDLSAQDYLSWVEEVAAQVKALAPGHWVGTGEEGLDQSLAGYDRAFWGATAPHLFSGAGGFGHSLAAPSVDFASIHLFPESWDIPPGQIAEAGARWISEHAALAHQAQKPLLLGEFGLRNQGAFTLEERRAMYRGWLSCAARVGLAGAAPWMFANDSRPDGWDLHTFSWREGTAPEAPGNRYADLLGEAAAR